MIEVEEKAAHVLVVDFAPAVRLLLRDNLRREDGDLIPFPIHSYNKQNGVIRYGNETYDYMLSHNSIMPPYGVSQQLSVRTNFYACHFLYYMYYMYHYSGYYKLTSNTGPDFISQL